MSILYVVLDKLSILNNCRINNIHYLTYSTLPNCIYIIFIFITLVYPIQINFLVSNFIFNMVIE